MIRNKETEEKLNFHVIAYDILDVISEEKREKFKEKVKEIREANKIHGTRRPIKRKSEKVCIVRLFGRKKDGQSVTLSVENFYPYYFVRLPGDTFPKNNLHLIETSFKIMIPSYYNKSYFLDNKVTYMEDVYGFKAKKKFPFLKISFDSIAAFNKMRNIISAHNQRIQRSEMCKTLLTSLNKMDIDTYAEYIEKFVKHVRNIKDNNQRAFEAISEEVSPFSTLMDGRRKANIRTDEIIKPSMIKKKGNSQIISDAIERTKNNLQRIINKTKNIIPYELPLYESNVPPLIRFLHMRNLQSCGWVSISKNDLSSDYGVDVTTDLVYKTQFCNIRHLASDDIAPFIEASFDIEADSSHGNFPLATKTYKQLIYDLVTHYYNEKRDGINHDTKYLKQLLYSAFENGTSNIIKKVYTKKEMTEEELINILNTYTDKIYDIINSIISLKIERVRLKGSKMKQTQVNQRKKDIDNEISSIENGLDGLFTSIFPAVHGDACIQIGTTFIKFGDKECYKRVIFTLDTCSPIDGVEVYAFKNEGDMIRAWTQYMQKEDTDIILGYNTFGFDWKYLYDRAKELGVLADFSKLSRYKNKASEFVMKELSSSALGNNTLYYMDTIGRIQLDLYKVIQGDVMIKLASYKLDSVAAEFMTGKVLDAEIIETEEGKCDEEEGKEEGEDEGEVCTVLTTDKIGYLQPGNYITLLANNGAFKENVFSGNVHKFRIVKLIDNDEEKKIYIKGRHSFKLDEYLECKWCEGKDDVSPQDIFRLQKGSAKDRATIAAYCVQDCELCNRLMLRLDILVTRISMANVCSVPLQWIITRGQGIKALSLVAKYCRKEKVAIPVLDRSQLNTDSYEGAIVLHPHKKIYITDDEIVSVLDFNSLYPSCMIAENFSLDTIVLDDKYDNLPGYEYNEISYPIYGEDPNDKSNKKVKKKIQIGTQVVRFTRPKDDRNESKGIIPRILIDLLKARKDTRTRMEGLTDPAKLAVLNGQQLAFKVTANSIYGQLGASTSHICCKKVAASTTASGRQNLLFAKKVAEEKYGCQTVYGDSVTENTPILVLEDDELRYYAIKDLPTYAYINCTLDGKEYTKPFNNLCVWSDKGFTRIHHIMRHKVNKDIYKIKCDNGSVEVTEDHSLLDEYGGEISPKSLKTGDRLLANNFPNESKFNRYNVNEAMVYGAFYACGSMDDNEWKIENCLSTHLQVIANILNTSPLFSIKKKIRLIKENNKYKLSMKRSIVGDQAYDIFTHKFKSFTYVNNEKCIPDFILNGNKWTKRQFMLGLSIYAPILKSLSDVEKAKITLIIISIQNNDNNKEKNKNVRYATVKSITKITNNNGRYVYDLETENHHFAAGIGQLIVHNTDSIFVKFPVRYVSKCKTREEKITRVLEISEELGALISGQLKPPHNLEFEKAISPFVLISKKRYVGKYYTDKNKPTKHYINSMGIELKRRDNAPIVKQIFGGIINIIMRDRDIEKSKDFLHKSLDDVLNGLIPFEKFIITKTLGVYKNPESVAHKVLADRMAARDPGNAPQVNSRIPFVYVTNEDIRKNKDAKQGDKIENPTFVKNNMDKLEIDYLFYVTNQIMKPIARVFSLEYHNQGDLHDDKFLKLAMEQVEKVLFQPHIRKFLLKRNKQRSIDSFFTFEEKKESEEGSENDNIERKGNGNGNKRKSSETNKDRKNNKKRILSTYRKSSKINPKGQTNIMNFFS